MSLSILGKDVNLIFISMNKLVVNRCNLRENFEFLQGQTHAKVVPVVKADGYGLGAVEIVESLIQQGCQEFFVATLEEALELRALYTVSYTHLTLPTSG